MSSFIANAVVSPGVARRWHIAGLACEEDPQLVLTPRVLLPALLFVPNRCRRTAEPGVRGGLAPCCVSGRCVASVCTPTSVASGSYASVWQPVVETAGARKGKRGITGVDEPLGEDSGEVVYAKEFRLDAEKLKAGILDLKDLKEAIEHLDRSEQWLAWLSMLRFLFGRGCGSWKDSPNLWSPMTQLNSEPCSVLTKQGASSSNASMATGSPASPEFQHEEPLWLW